MLYIVALRAQCFLDICADHDVSSDVHMFGVRFIVKNLPGNTIIRITSHPKQKYDFKMNVK